MKLPHARRAVLAATLASLGIASTAPRVSAQVALYWDGDGAGTVGGGSGTWNTTLLRWSLTPDGNTYQAWVNANNDDAVFGNVPGLVTLSGALTARSIDLQVSGYTLSGGSLTLAGSSFGTLNVAAGTGTMSTIVAGASGFTKTGPGTLVFRANSTVTGNRRILDGVVSIDNTLRFANSGTITLDGGTLEQTNTGSGGSFVGASIGLDIGASGGTVSYTGGAGSSSIYAGTIRGPGNTLHKVGTGEFRYQGTGLPNTTYSKLVVKQGLFRLGFASNTQDERGFGAIPATLTADAITLDGGAIGTSFGVITHFNRGMTLGPGDGTFNTSNGAFTFQGPITGAGDLNKTGTHDLTLTASNDFTGGLRILSGSLIITAKDGLGSAVGGTSISSGATLGIRGGIDYTAAEPVTIGGHGVGGNGAIANLQDDNRFAGVITLTSSSTVGVTAGSLEFAGPIGGNFQLAKVGPGTLVLSNAGNSFGSIAFSGGPGIVSADAHLGAVPASPTINRVIIFDGGTLRAGASFTLHPNRGWSFFGSTAQVDVPDAFTLTYGGAVVGDTINKIGVGTLSLGGVATITGAANVNEGTLRLGPGASLPNDVNIAPAGTLRGSGTVGGNVAVNGTIAPGDSVGVLATTGDQTWSAGGTYEWEISSATGSPGTDWDQLTMSALNITASSGNTFKVKVVALPGTGGPALDNFDPDSPFAWLVALASSGAITGFDITAFEIDLTQFEKSNQNKGGFYFSRSGGDLMLNYVPEPSGALTGVFCVGAALVRRRRRRG